MSNYKIKKSVKSWYLVSKNPTKTYFDFWESNTKNSILNKNPLTTHQIILRGDFSRNDFKLGKKIRKVINLNKKDKDNNEYIIVIPSEKYFLSETIKSCLSKSQKLINKKYHFIDYKFYLTLIGTGRIQEIIDFFPSFPHFF